MSSTVTNQMRPPSAVISKRHFIKNEILSTEETYLASLDKIQRVSLTSFAKNSCPLNANLPHFYVCYRYSSTLYSSARYYQDNN